MSALLKKGGQKCFKLELILNPLGELLSVQSSVAFSLFVA